MKKGSWQTKKASTWWMWLFLSLSGSMQIWHYEMLKNMVNQYGLELRRIAKTNFYLIGIVVSLISAVLSIVIMKRLHVQRQQQRARSTYGMQGVMAISTRKGSHKLVNINLLTLVAMTATVVSLGMMITMIMQRII